MKSAFSFILLFILLSYKNIFSNTGIAYIENVLVIGTVFSWDVYYERTGEWTTGTISNIFGSSAASFNFNTSALTSPSILVEPGCPLDNSSYTITIRIIRDKCVVDISVSPDSIISAFIINVPIKIFTISMIITDPSQTADLSWDSWNTGFFDNADQTVFTDLTGSSIIPLPVELSLFTARVKEDNIILEWRTETEINNYGFEIEREVIGNQWERIGFVEGAGNSNSPKDYRFIDEDPAGENKFSYRLKQIDNNGNYSYSDVITVEISPADYELFQNYPNPFNPTTTIKFSLIKPGLVTLKVYDSLGQEVVTLIKDFLPAGKHKTEVNADGFASGVYLYRIEAENFISSKKMVLIK